MLKGKTVNYDNFSIDPAYQQSIPILDGGAGCSEYVIYGTTVDLGESTTDTTAKL